MATALKSTPLVGFTDSQFVIDIVVSETNDNSSESFREELLDSILLSWNSLHYPAVILDPSSVADLLVRNVTEVNLANLSNQYGSLTCEQDVFPVLRNFGCRYGQASVCLPLEGRSMFMFYRADVLRDAKLPVPETWEQLLQALKILNGTDFNGDGQPDSALCMNYDQRCLPIWIQAILAQTTQYTGTNQGHFLKVVAEGRATVTFEVELLLASEAGIEALKLLKQLLQYTSQGTPFADATGGYGGPQEHCETYTKAFVHSKCAFAIADGSMMQGISAMASTPTGFKVAHNTLITHLPGSARILDREANTMVDCDDGVCPFATKDSSGTWVNRTPVSGFVGMAVIFDLMATTSRHMALVYKRVADFICGKGLSDLVYRMDVDVLPSLKSHLELQNWVDAGYPTPLVETYLAATNDALNHQNAALDIRFPKFESWQEIMIATVEEFLGADGVDLAAEYISIITTQWNEWRLSIIEDDGEAAWQNYINIYLKSLQTSVVLEHNKNRDRVHRMRRAIFLVTICCVGMVFILASMVVTLFIGFRKSGDHRNFMGKVLPPSGGPDTTLLAAQLVGYDSLTELLPTPIVEQVQLLQHWCIRSLLNKHSGYESLNSKGHLLLAFHSAQDALQFAVDANALMMKLPWPDALLELMDYSRVFLSSVAPDPFVSGGGDVMAPWEEAEPEEPTGRPAAQTLPHAVSRRHSSVTGSRLGTNKSNESKRVPRKFCELYKDAWVKSAQGERNAVLAFRGPRLSMAICTGSIESHHIHIRLETGKTEYGGVIAEMAHQMHELATPGMILISDSTYEKLPMELMWRNLVLIHCGKFCVVDNHATNIYQILDHNLRCRTSMLNPVQSPSQMVLGAPDAPLGSVSIVFAYVLGVSALMSWNAEVTQEALAMFHDMATRELLHWRGYQVEAANNLVLVAFGSPVDAVGWCVRCHQAALELPWPEKLLQQEMGEVVTMEMESEEGVKMSKVIFRGLKLKMGIDRGDVLGSLHPITGRITYRGRVMNRAARIASFASAGQVLCSADVWHVAKHAHLNLGGCLIGRSVGMQNLKGVQEPMEIFNVSCHDLPSNTDALLDWSISSYRIFGSSSGGPEPDSSNMTSQLSSSHSQPSGSGLNSSGSGLTPSDSTPLPMHILTKLLESTSEGGSKEGLVRQYSVLDDLQAGILTALGHPAPSSNNSRRPSTTPKPEGIEEVGHAPHSMTRLSQASAPSNSGLQQDQVEDAAQEIV